MKIKMRMVMLSKINDFFFSFWGGFQKFYCSIINKGSSKQTQLDRGGDLFLNETVFPFTPTEDKELPLMTKSDITMLPSLTVAPGCFIRS